uniref:cytoskeleton-associated protein 2-like n=1 Tax=Epinephelus lanceolatus TaxID=310571 RepID=UPI00144649D1|nr:cytoskeleton-associated protein 2-like [Epinephelus lanceolatus]
MEEAETIPIRSRKELRKQKLMEYLSGKGKLKQLNSKPYLHDDIQVKRPVTSTQKVVMEKENTAPADRFRYEGTKIQTLAAQSTKQPAREAFGVTNKVNIKANIPTGRRNNSRTAATSGPAQPKLNQNPVLTRTYTVVSSKSNWNEATHPKKRPETGSPSSGRISSNAAHTAATKSNSRFSRSSNATRSCPVKTASIRMSLGPMVKTKTGLIPAVTQPRNTQSQNLRHTSAKAADTTIATTASVANKVRSSSLSSASVSQRSAMAQRKTLPATALNNPVNERSTAGIKVQQQNKLNSKPLLGKQSQPSCKSQLTCGLNSVSTSSKCTAAPIKPKGREGLSKTVKSAGQPTDRCTKQRFESGGQKNGQSRKVAAQTSSGPTSRCSSRAVSGVRRAAVAELRGKTMTCKETDGKKGSANAPPPKRTGAPVMSQTVPRPARTISHTSQGTDTKMPKVPVRVLPQTEGKKVTAAQEERMRKLREWREAKGISYKRPPMPVKPQVRRTVAVPQPFWATMNEEDEAHSLICAMDRSLADCIKLLGEGCPPDQVREVLTRLPAVSQKFTKYWICQARLMEQEGNLDVLPMFEEAVGLVVEPVDELRTVVFEILKKKDEIQVSAENEKEEDQIPTGESTPESINNLMMTPKPVRALIWGEKGDSSVVKYKITATPGGPPSQQKDPARVNGHEVRFFTPVRRSVRIERSSLQYPASLQDHDQCVASYNDLISEEDTERSEEQTSRETSPSANNTPMYVYRQNEALNDKVFVQLVYDEGV